MSLMGRYLRIAASRPRRYVFTLLLGVVVSALVAQSPMYGQLSRWLEDTVHGITAERIRFEDVLVIDIDEPAMAALEPTLGAWPYSRDVYADVLAFLHGAGARSVVFDILLLERRAGDQAFARTLAEVPDVWLAARGQHFALERPEGYFSRLDHHAWQVPANAVATPWQDILLPAPGLDEHAGVGIISVTPDADGVLRRVALLHEAYGRVLPAMPLAALFPGGTPPGIAADPHRLRAGEREWRLDGAGNALLRIPRNKDFLRILGFDQVLAAARGHAGGVDAGQIRGRTVFIGSSAAVLGDYARIPVHGRTAGLGILALAFAALSHDLVLRPSVLALDLLLIVLAAALPLFYTNRRRCSETVIVFWAVMGMAAALTLHVALFGWFNRTSDAAFAITVALSVTVIQLSLRFQTLYEERRQLWLDKRAADEANALKGRFLAHMTHELRTPLTAIMGYNRLLAEDTVSDDERRQRTAVVERNGQHLLALINNLLDQAKIEAGQMSVEPEPVRVRELIEECAATLRPLAAEKGLDLKVRCPDDVPEAVLVDPLRVRQILLNLTGNAIKFTDRGHVELAVYWGEDRLEAHVVDTGPGMSDAALARIFDAFQQADSTITRSHGGTGLGLTISRNLAGMMGGDIKVASRPGEGTRFTVTLDAPQVDAPPQEDVSRARPPGAGPPTAGSSQADPPADRTPEGAQSGAQSGPASDPPGASTPHILIADDTEDIRELLGLQLRRMGVRVSTARDGQEAVNEALGEAPDLVLMDVEMPVMNGLDATRALREAGFRGIILALTAHSDERFLERIRGSGCDGILAKPLPKARLAAVLEEYLGVGT